MHVLVATDGHLDPEFAAEFAGRLAGSDGRVTVLTVVEIPRRLLEDLRSIYGERPPTSVDTDAEYVGGPKPGAGPSRGWPGDDEMLTRYLHDRRQQNTGPVLDALRASGVDATDRADEGEDPAATIVDVAGEIGADVVVVGSRGRGLLAGLLGSTGTKLVRHCPCPVLVLRRDAA